MDKIICVVRVTKQGQKRVTIPREYKDIKNKDLVEIRKVKIK